MDVASFLPLCEGLVAEHVEPTTTTLTVVVRSLDLARSCPVCQQPSDHLHSRYQRVVTDLPCGGRQVTLHLLVRKFYCRNHACSRLIFTERLPDLV